MPRPAHNGQVTKKPADSENLPGLSLAAAIFRKRKNITLHTCNAISTVIKKKEV
jgi:hypothetical protein